MGWRSWTTLMREEMPLFMGSGLIATLLLLFFVFDGDECWRSVELLSPVAAVLASPPGFYGVWAGWTALASLTDLERFRSYHEWRAQSQLLYLQTNGLGYTLGPPYGSEFLRKILMPQWLVKNTAIFCILLVSWIACLGSLTMVLLTPCAAEHALWRGVLSRCLAGFAFLLYFPVFGQLTFDSRVGSHASAMLPQVLIFACLCGCADSSVHAWHGTSMLKFVLGVQYTCSGMCKVLAGVYYEDSMAKTGSSSGPSFRSALRWAEGSVQCFILQGLVYRSSLSVPESNSWLRKGLKSLHEWIVCNRLACTRMALAAITVEVSAAVVVIFAPWQLQLDWAVAAMGVHLGMWAPAGFDFVTYWAPALLVFGVRAPNEYPFIDVASMVEMTSQGSLDAPVVNAVSTILFAVACLYFVRAVWVAIWFRDLFDPVKGSAIPFGSWPMFASCCDIFDGAPKQWCFASMDPRQSGQVEAFLMINGKSFAILDLMAAQEKTKTSGLGSFPYQAIWFTTFSSPVVAGAKDRSTSRLSIETTTGFIVSPDLKRALEEIANILARETQLREQTAKRESNSSGSGWLMRLVNPKHDSSDRAVKDLLGAFSRARAGFAKRAV